MFIIRGDSASNVLWRCRQQVADAESHARAFTWLHTLVDQEREGISTVGFTLKEVYSVLCCGNFEDPDRSASNTICSPELLAELQPAGPGSVLLLRAEGKAPFTGPAGWRGSRTG